MTERDYYLAFSAFPGVGPVRFSLLLSHFGNAKSAYEASANDLLKINFGPKLTANFVAFRREFSVNGYAQKLKDLEIATLILTDEKYPKFLKEIPDPPFVLYVKGKKVSDWDISKSIGVVGTRKVTPYGREVTTFLTQQLAAMGLTIVSGLALGVDAVAHEAAIKAHGKTIAVLGCGVDCCNPPTNKWLYDQIINGNGAVISEMPLSLQPNKGLFPSRNRIISGLSLGVLVTEGAKDSGSLITARNAAEQGREVFAVPGPITSTYSKGPAELLKKGAKLVTTVEDILEEFQIKNNPTSPRLRGIQAETPEETKIIQILETESLHFDEIVRIISMPAGKVGSLLSVMEIKGMVKNVGNNRYSIC